jgi:hypothetical protein
MGSEMSVRNTKIGKSIIGKRFKTTESVCLGFTTYGDVYSIDRWDNKSWLINPKLGSFDVEVKEGLEFVVIDVIKRWGIDSGVTISILTKILNDIPTSSLGNFREANKDYSWSESSVGDTKNSNFPKVENSLLKTKGITATLCWRDFGISSKGEDELEIREGILNYIEG